MKAATSGSFYPIVDVLRAISVVGVVAYHAGVPWISGGYVGVDVFFVISGFLIIGQILKERRQARFSYSAFWAKRALRILPSYLLVITVSSAVAAYVLVLPEEIAEYGRQVTWSALMAVNHLFLSEQGYFDVAAESKPLLHLWSLAVEEQFYLVAPIVLGLLGFASRRFSGGAGRYLYMAAVAAMFLASLVLCVRYTGIGGDSKNYSFYLMPLRAWEFILGGAIPWVVPSLARLHSRWLTTLMATGFGLILLAMFGFDQRTPFPSGYALMPVIGSALVIAVGLCKPGLRLATALAARPVLWVGLVSYAWYLWHWPLLAFARIYNFGELPGVWGASMAGLSFMLACATYAYIEGPIKEWRITARVKLDFKPVLGGLLACIAVASIGGGLSGKLSQRAERSIPAAMLPGSVGNAGDCTLNKVRTSKPCQAQLAKEGNGRVGLLLGDSHAGAAFSALRELAAKRNSSLVAMTRVGCVPMTGVRVYYTEGGELYNCHQVKERGLAYVFKRELKPEYAIMYAHWNNATPWVKWNGDIGSPYRYLTNAKTGSSEPAEDVFVASVRDTIQKLEKAGVKRVLIIAATPEFIRAPAGCVIRSDRYGVDRDRHCSVSAEQTVRRRYFSTDWLAKSVEGMPAVRLVDPMPVFCDSQTCRGYTDRAVLYRDDDHINQRGMRTIIERYRSEFDWVVGR